ncbi:MAG: transcriptional repressor [Gammaproteobacteria bacterium]|nr:transcriptional repressor [Gammaproteobacteria bacterium]
MKTGESLRSRVESTLNAHGVKVTAQRVEIGALLLAGPCHLSADQILQQLRRAGSPVSKATVYNTLKLFSARGIVQAVALDPTRLVYDSTTTPHHHFLNEDTGALTDIDPECVELRQLPPLPEGTRQERVQLIIRVRARKPARA